MNFPKFRFNVGDKVYVITESDALGTILEQHTSNSDKPWYAVKLDGKERAWLYQEQELRALELDSKPEFKSIWDNNSK